MPNGSWASARTRPLNRASNARACRCNPEVGIGMSSETPKVLAMEVVQASDVVITMGCGDTCPVFPGKKYLDWKLDDPAGQGVEAVRPIRDEIEKRVRVLLTEVHPH
ncbi:arsenate reductase ArsC [Streptomyces sp. NPDC021356]|uniref:arsenate reductase/protein-tyrosine-phosphatase family protein n=1 Tax=Streptomyces sp. NPDC021356 TaxID=3154900 RepID=UPI0034003D56